MFGLGKKKAGATPDKAAAIKKAAEKGIFLSDEPTPTPPPAPVVAPVTPEPAATPVATAPASEPAPAPKAAKPAAPAPVAPAPKPIVVAKPAADISYSNGEPYVQFARRRPGANMKSFLDMAKQMRG